MAPLDERLQAALTVAGMEVDQRRESIPTLRQFRDGFLSTNADLKGEAAE